MSERQEGVVKFFNDKKGFGFITPNGGGRDVFVHISSVQRSGLEGLVEGDRVSFETEPSRKEGKGDVAVKLKVLG
jgi:cold shock protein